LSILSPYSPINQTENSLAVRDVRQTGEITWRPAVGGWCINPSTSFQLTVIGSDEQTACEIREALDGLVDHYSDDVTEAVAGLVAERGARFLEFEDYLQAQRKIYHVALASARNVGIETGCQPDAEAEDEFESKAFDSLDCCCPDFEMLVAGDYPNDPAELTAIRIFGYGNLLRYLGTGPESAQLAPPGHRRRVGLEALTRAELAISADRLSEIPTESLLYTMAVQQIQSLSSIAIPSKLRKKKLAIEFVLAQDGIRERAIAATALDSLFYLVAPPPTLSSLDLDGFHDRMSFTRGMTSLVVTTYLTAALAATNREYEGKQLSEERFKVHNVRDIFTCRSCYATHGVSKLLAEWTQFPFHFGCRCSLLIDCSDGPLLRSNP
jgi:hypothetical protein